MVGFVDLAKELLDVYARLLKLSDEARSRGYDKYDFFEKLLNALDGVSSAISRMRARGILDPSIDDKIKELILK